MVTTNKKLLKEIKAIYSASDKAQKLAAAELDKIDAKYRALAEEEKKSLKDVIKSMQAQLEYYKSLLGEVDVEDIANSVVEPVAEKPEQEELVVDTLFAENNEPEKEIPFEKAAEDLDAEEDNEWEDRIDSGELTKVEPSNGLAEIWPDEEKTGDEQPAEEEEDAWPETVEEW